MDYRKHQEYIDNQEYSMGGRHSVQRNSTQLYVQLHRVARSAVVRVVAREASRAGQPPFWGEERAAHRSP